MCPSGFLRITGQETTSWPLHGLGKKQKQKQRQNQEEKPPGLVLPASSTQSRFVPFGKEKVYKIQLSHDNAEQRNIMY